MESFPCFLKKEKEKERKFIYSFCFLTAKPNVKEASVHGQSLCVLVGGPVPCGQALHQFYSVNTCTTLMIRRHLVDSLKFHLLMINALFALATLPCMGLDNWAQSGICIKVFKNGKTKSKSIRMGSACWYKSSIAHFPENKHIENVFPSGWCAEKGGKDKPVCGFSAVCCTGPQWETVRLSSVTHGFNKKFPSREHLQTLVLTLFKASLRVGRAGCGCGLQQNRQRCCTRNYIHSKL